jgi:hypothetical protein
MESKNIAHICFLKGFWIEAFTCISLFTPHEYKKIHANYFWKFKNNEVHYYYSMSSIEKGY